MQRPSAGKKPLHRLSCRKQKLFVQTPEDNPRLIPPLDSGPSLVFLGGGSGVMRLFEKIRRKKKNQIPSDLIGLVQMSHANMKTLLMASSKSFRRLVTLPDTLR